MRTFHTRTTFQTFSLYILFSNNESLAKHVLIDDYKNLSNSPNYSIQIYAYKLNVSAARTTKLCYEFFFFFETEIIASKTILLKMGIKESILYFS